MMPGEASLSSHHAPSRRRNRPQEAAKRKRRVFGPEGQAAAGPPAPGRPAGPYEARFGKQLAFTGWPSAAVAGRLARTAVKFRNSPKIALAGSIPAPAPHLPRRRPSCEPAPQEGALRTYRLSRAACRLPLLALAASAPFCWLCLPVLPFAGSGRLCRLLLALAACAVICWLWLASFGNCGNSGRASYFVGGRLGLALPRRGRPKAWKGQGGMGAWGPGKRK